MKAEEALLIKNAKKGHADSFGELIRIYEKQVYNIALRFTGNPDDACDIAQDTFLRAYNYIKSFKEESAFSTWLYRIAVNCCNDYVKKKSRLKSVPLFTSNEDGDEDEIQIPDTKNCPEEIYEKEQLKDLIKSAIESLPDDFRMALIMRDINGLSYEEIAEALSIELGTVKSRIARGRERLKTYILKSGNFDYYIKSNKMKGGSGNDKL